MRKLLIWGAGDQGTVTLDCALAMDIYGKIDFLEIKEKGRRDIPDYTIYREDEIVLNDFLKSYDEVIVATGDNGLRESKQLLLESMGIPLAAIIHPTAVVSHFAKVSRGCTVLANAVINVNAVIGRGCIINTGAVVEHDCAIKEFSNISPKAAMAGHTEIGRKTFLGIGSTIIDGIKVGEDVIVGAGAVVIGDVPNGAVVVGVPAKIIGHSR